tara:strand:+ start:252 stop:428 length:177 start_codon:yes stop_codon:yes gene_type:complete
MKNKALYITVKLDVEFQDKLKWKEVKEQLISEMSYTFEYFENGIEIVDTEICGESETI